MSKFAIKSSLARWANSSEWIACPKCGQAFSRAQLLGDAAENKHIQTQPQLTVAPAAVSAPAPQCMFAPPPPAFVDKLTQNLAEIKSFEKTLEQRFWEP